MKVCKIHWCYCKTIVIPYKDRSLQHLHCVHTHSHIVADSLLFSVHCHHNWHYLYELVQYLNYNELI